MKKESDSTEFGPARNIVQIAISSGTEDSPGVLVAVDNFGRAWQYRPVVKSWTVLPELPRTIKAEHER